MTQNIGNLLKPLFMGEIGNYRFIVDGSYKGLTTDNKAYFYAYVMFMDKLDEDATTWMFQVKSDKSCDSYMVDESYDLDIADMTDNGDNWDEDDELIKLEEFGQNVLNMDEIDNDAVMHELDILGIGDDIRNGAPNGKYGVIDPNRNESL